MKLYIVTGKLYQSAELASSSEEFPEYVTLEYEAECLTALDAIVKTFEMVGVHPDRVEITGVVLSD